ncbi:MAG: isochorismatase family protein [Syntrophales bacterium]|nr:isochorismatase family protein [Syntrophales bacterium]
METGRKAVILSSGGIDSTTAMAIAKSEGFEIYIVADCCGDISTEAHAMAMQRCIQAGAVPMTWIQTILEWQRDWSRKATYEGITRILRDHGGAYGMGIEYAATMVHKLPPSQPAAG